MTEPPCRNRHHNEPNSQYLSPHINSKDHEMRADRMQAKSSITGRPAHVLFYAAIPPLEIKDQMAKAWQAVGTDDTFRHATLHLSIYPVAGTDDLDPIFVQRALQAASSLRTAPFTIHFDRVMTFKGRSAKCPLVMTTDGANDNLDEVAADLHAACRAIGLGSSRSTKITPHVTLAYGPGFSGTRHLARPIPWEINEIALIDSIQGHGRHIELGRRPLPKDRQQAAFDF